MKKPFGCPSRTWLILATRDKAYTSAKVLLCGSRIKRGRLSEEAKPLEIPLWPPLFLQLANVPDAVQQYFDTPV